MTLDIHAVHEEIEKRIKWLEEVLLRKPFRDNGLVLHDNRF